MRKSGKDMLLWCVGKNLAVQRRELLLVYCCEQQKKLVFVKSVFPTFLPPSLTGSPLKYHRTSGVGVPRAPQWRRTGEPGGMPEGPSST